MTDDSESIRLKIRKAKTDSNSEGKITYDPQNRRELANLLRIYAAIEGINVKKVDQLFESDNMFSFKEKLSNKLIDKICPIGDRTIDLCMNKEDMLMEILDKGAEVANKTAERTMSQLKKQVGIYQRRK